MSDEITLFENDDPGYLAWVRRNGGYVLTEPIKGEFMLHEADCPHLGGDGITLTAKPRRCARATRTLIEWVRAETGRLPSQCRTCR